MGGSVRPWCLLMHLPATDESFRLLSWARVREFGVPPPMIESATARRTAGDWAGACAAAHVDVDLDLRAIGRAHGRDLAAAIRADLRQLAPDLLRWHFPRAGPDLLLRPGITLSLARYAVPSGDLCLVARTPPAWASAGQRISLAMWARSRPGDGAGRHPHPRPDPRFRLDLHRHLWDARRSGELAERTGKWPLDAVPEVPDGIESCAVDRWLPEAALLLRAEGRDRGQVAVRLTAKHRVLLRLGDPPDRPGHRPALLPDAATWVPPDVELLHAGLLGADRLHPLVAAALRPGGDPAGQAQNPSGTTDSRLVDCRGVLHRIGVVDGVLVPLDHPPGEIRREELLAALSGDPLPCLRAIDDAHRHPENLADVRAQLGHGDAAGALATVESLLGPDVLLRSGALRDELEAAARGRIAHGLYRTGLAGYGPPRDTKIAKRRAARPVR